MIIQANYAFAPLTTLKISGPEVELVLVPVTKNAVAYRYGLAIATAALTTGTSPKANSSILSFLSSAASI